MRIQECEFPDDLLYDADGMTWARQESGGHVLVGITSIQAAVAGKLTSVLGKPAGVLYARGEGVGALESGRYFGVIRTPVRGLLVAVNEAVLQKPKLLSEAPYSDGWFAHLRAEDWAADLQVLRSPDAAKDLLKSQIDALRVRCFAAFPDHEMYEIGVECSAVLLRLNELLDRIDVGEVVHIVSDDWTAPVEMDRWVGETGHALLEIRREGNLYHILVRKAR